MSVQIQTRHITEKENQEFPQPYRNATQFKRWLSDESATANYIYIKYSPVRDKTTYKLTYDRTNNERERE